LIASVIENLLSQYFKYLLIKSNLIVMFKTTMLNETVPFWITPRSKSRHKPLCFADRVNQSLLIGAFFHNWWSFWLQVASAVLTWWRLLALTTSTHNPLTLFFNWKHSLSVSTKVNFWLSSFSSHAQPLTLPVYFVLYCYGNKLDSFLLWAWLVHFDWNLLLAQLLVLFLFWSHCKKLDWSDTHQHA